MDSTENYLEKINLFFYADSKNSIFYKRYSYYLQVNISTQVCNNISI